MAKLSFRHMDKIYPNNVQAVFDFNLEIKDKEFIILVGPSVCGKSPRLLRRNYCNGGELQTGIRLVPIQILGEMGEYAAER